MNKKKFFIFTAFLVVFLTACSGQNTAGDQKTGNGLSYTDPAYKFSFSYPTDWKVTPINSSTVVLPVPYLKAVQVAKMSGPYLNATPSFVAVVLETDVQKIVQDIQESDVAGNNRDQTGLEVSGTQETTVNSHSGYKGKFKDRDGGTEYFYAFPVPNRSLTLYVQYRSLENYNQVNEAVVNSINFNT